MRRASHPSAESATAINALASFHASADVMIGPDVVPTRHPRCSVKLGRLASRATLPPKPTMRPPGSRRSVSSSLLSIWPSLVKCCRNEIHHAEMIVMSRHLRTWNIPECRQEGAVCPTPPDLVFSQATALWGSR